MTSITKDAWDLVKVHGRTKKGERPTLFWTGSGIELNVKASQLSLVLEASYNTYEQYVTILVNGAMVSRVCLTKGTHEIAVLRNMNRETVYNVRLIRDVLPPAGDWNNYIDVVDILTDGELLPVEERPHKLVFIGDSITCGEGCMGAKQDMDWVSMYFSGYQNYTYMTAEAVDAEYQVVAQSGWGIHSGWDNNVRTAVPKYYTKVCGWLTGDEIEKRGALEEYDFSEFVPDVVVLNLGTNDASAFDQPAWVEPDTGIAYKQEKREDGTYEEASKKRFADDAIAFLKTLREKHPTAHILWVYGMLGTPLEPVMKETLEAYKEQTGDTNCSYLQLPDTTDETVGSRMHPGYLSHLAASKVLVPRIKELLK